MARRLLAAIGATTRQEIAFALQVAALCWGVVYEGVRPSTWRRTIRGALRISLTDIVASTLAKAGSQGLSSGADAEILGTRVGMIRRVVIDPTQRLYADAELDRSATSFIQRDSSAIIKERYAIAGAPYLEITPGTGISSLAGQRMTFFGSAEYTAAKHGVVGLTYHLAWELAELRITVNAMCPGAVLTPMAEENSTPEFRETVTKRLIPLGRWCTPEDIGETASFLASPKALRRPGCAGLQPRCADPGRRARQSEPETLRELGPESITLGDGSGRG